MLTFFFPTGIYIFFTKYEYNMCERIPRPQEEGRTALSLALMEEREDIADLVLSIDETDVNNPDEVVSIGQQ